MKTTTYFINNANLWLRQFVMDVKRSPKKYLALLLFLCISLPVTYWGRYERSGWIAMTTPTDSRNVSNPLLGYSYLFGSLPIMKENAPFLNLVQFFNGADIGVHYYFVRGLVGFVAAIFTPILGVFGAYTLLNYLCWLAAAYIGWRFTYAIFEDKTAALITVILVAGGIGWTAHIGDYSAHLMSFTFYYLGIYLIYKSDIWRSEQPLKTHLFLGAFFGLATIQYNTGLYLIVGYLILALRYNRWSHIATGVLLGMGGQVIWHAWLNEINILFNNAPGWTNYYAFEAKQQHKAIANWLLYLSDGSWLTFALTTLIGEIVMFFDSPLVVILGIAAFFFLPKISQLRIFYLVFFTLPMLGSLFWSAAFVGVAKGYLIFGVTLLLYSAFSGMISKALRHPHKAVNVAGWSLLSIVLISHLLWGSAHLWGYSAPVKIYFVGFLQNDTNLPGVKPEVLSLTGQEPTPTLFGGNVPLSSAGVLIRAPKFSVPKVSFARSLFVRLPVFTYLTLLILTSLCALSIQISRRGISASLEHPRIFVGFLAAWVILALIPVLKPAEMPAGYDTNTTPIPQDGMIQYEVNLSKAFISALENNTIRYPDNVLMFYTLANRRGNLDIAYEIDNLQIQCDYYSFSLCVANGEEVIKLLKTDPKLVLKISALKTGTQVFGWQSNDLPERFLDRTFHEKRNDIAPALELRLYHRDSRGNMYLLLAGF